MVIVLHKDVPKTNIEKLKTKIEILGCQTFEVQGRYDHVIGLLGDTSKLDIDIIRSNQSVERVVRIHEPFKKANKLFKPEDTVVEIMGRKIGGGHIGVIAGPCSVESRDQIVEIATRVKQSGAGFLRGGAFKPRTSPYSFQGLRETGLDLLLEAKQITGLPIVTEIMSASHLDLFVEHVDMLQVGARNMQNFELLKEIGKTKIPVLLKRGLSASIEEFIMSAEYIMSEGNENIVLCERGIRTFEQYTRNTLDLSAIPAIKRLSHLPIIVDPSHAAGLAWMVEPLAKAAIAVGADGLMIEVHNDPANAKSDGQQSITPQEFDDLMKVIHQLSQIENKTISA